jgi:hypothetical protein
MAEIVTTLEALIAADAALKRLVDQPISVAASYRLAVLSKSVEAAMAPYRTAHETLVRKYGEERPTTDEERTRMPGAGASVLMVKPEHAEAFSREYADLVKEAVTLPHAPFDLATVPTVLLSAREVGALGPLVTWNGEGPPDVT